MSPDALDRRIRSAPLAGGGCGRTLSIGCWSVRLDGLDAALSRQLDRRWGPFLTGPAGSEAATLTVEVVRAGPAAWLDDAGRGGPYRLERSGAPGAPPIFAAEWWALGSKGRPGAWRAALTEPSPEPAERILDNVARVLVSGLALDHGGIALHAAGILRGDRAHVLAGPSRAGKSTAVGLAEGAPTLGDDFGVLLPGGATGWLAAAVPFDNAERIEPGARQGLYPLAAVWRLRQAAAPRIERPPQALGVAGLLGCAAFPWLFPDRAAELVERVRSLVAGGLYAELHFTRALSLWRQLELA